MVDFDYNNFRGASDKLSNITWIHWIVIGIKAATKRVHFKWDTMTQYMIFDKQHSLSVSLHGIQTEYCDYYYS